MQTHAVVQPTDVVREAKTSAKLAKYPFGPKCKNVGDVNGALEALAKAWQCCHHMTFEVIFYIKWLLFKLKL